MISFLTAATKPLDTQNTIMALCPFSQQRWEVALRNGVTWSYAKFKAHFTIFFLYTGSVADIMKLLKHRKLDETIFQDSENSIDNFRVGDPIDEI